MSDLVVLRNSHGADEANVNGRSFPRQPDGLFYVPEDVALQLLALPAGFAAAPDEPTLETSTMTRHFLVLDPAGNPHPHAQLEIGGPGGTYEADEFGIIRAANMNHAAGLLVCGAVPLLPVGWLDPRVTPAK
jgi:hypothetical protein